MLAWTTETFVIAVQSRSLEGLSSTWTFRQNQGVS
jgi:hypothetical protein